MVREETPEQALLAYEGLVKQTARMLVDGTHPDMNGRKPIEEPLEDIEQVLRIKVLRALRAFDPAKVRGDHRRSVRGFSRRDLYVNMCVRDQAKDIAKKRRRHDQYIEDYRDSEPHSDRNSGKNDKFDTRYLSETAEQAFAEVEDEFPQLPATITEKERGVLTLMYAEHRQTEIARILGLSKREVESAVRQIRVKLAAFRPAPVPA